MNSPVPSRIALLRPASRSISANRPGMSRKKHCYVIIGTGLRIASRTRAKQHNTLEPFALHLNYGGAEAFKDWVVSWYALHAENIAYYGRRGKSPVSKTQIWPFMGFELNGQARAHLHDNLAD